MIPRFAMLLTVGLLAPAAELALPQAHLDVFADGARLWWRCEVPSGNHRLALPDRYSGTISVDGAAWRCEDAIADATPTLPKVMDGLLAERNRWAAAMVLLDDRSTAAAAARRQVQERLPALAARHPAATAAWQDTLDAVLTEDHAIATMAQQLDIQHDDLVRRAAQAVGDASRARSILALDQPHSCPVQTTQAVAAAWIEGSRRQVHHRTVVLACATPATVTVRLEVPRVSWHPAAVLAVDAERRLLVRQAHLYKPADLDLGTVLVRVASAPLDPPLHSPAAVAVRGRLVQVGSRTGRQATLGTTAGEWGPAKPRRADAPAEAEAESTTAIDQPAALTETWDLGPVTLPAGQAGVVCDRPAMALSASDDEWALIPETAPVLVRRLGAVLDGHPLLAGPLSLIVDGRPLDSQDLPAQPAGSTLWLRAGEDPSIHAEPPQGWDLSQEPQGPRRQVVGTTQLVHNLAAQERTVRIYRTWPISRSGGITVSLHAKTTPGSVETRPGVRRWDLTIPGGGAIPLHLGWTVTSDGSLDL